MTCYRCTIVPFVERNSATQLWAERIKCASDGVQAQSRSQPFPRTTSRAVGRASRVVRSRGPLLMPAVGYEVYASQGAGPFACDSGVSRANLHT